jgi:hypothetical protein
MPLRPGDNEGAPVPEQLTTSNINLTGVDMTHMRYWALSVATAAAGGFIAVDRFAFVPQHAIWIAFGVAIAAGVFSLAASAVALVRQNQRFSGLSAVSALIAGFTIIAMRTFTAPTALWLAFAG